jgi:hypothetical protein
MQFLVGTMNERLRTPRAHLGLADTKSLFVVHTHATAPHKRVECFCVACSTNSI